MYRGRASGQSGQSDRHFSLVLPEVPLASERHGDPPALANPRVYFAYYYAQLTTLTLHTYSLQSRGTTTTIIMMRRAACARTADVTTDSNKIGTNARRSQGAVDMVQWRRE